MPKLSTAENPQLAKQMLDKLAKDQRAPEAEVPMPEATPPPSNTSFTLPGGYLALDGELIKQVEVRELTGRDEEYLFKFKDSPGRFFAGVLECGVVRVGSEKATHEVLDSLLAGDWEAALIFVRIATFGAEIEEEYSCRSCGEKFGAIVDLTQLDMHEVDRSEFQFEVKGRHGDRYLLTHAVGSTQRKLLAKSADLNIADLNSVLLEDCLVSVNGIPSMGRDTVLDLPLADRRTILQAIDDRRVGPRLAEVTTKCPTCDNEQPAGLGIAAMFQ